MTEHLTALWHWYVTIATIVSLIACAIFLKMQTTRRLPKGEKAELHGNVWDEDLAELNNPLPNWWRWLFYITLIFSALYLLFFPGLGAFGGKLGWSSTGQYQAEVKQAEAEFGPLFAKFEKTDVPTLAKDAQATAMGQRLFLNYCAQCHGSDAAGGKGFPNLKDKDWLYGGDPAAILATLNNGRAGVMPAMIDAVGGEEGVKEVVSYVRSLSGLKHDAALAAKGQAKFAICAACHGQDGKGMRALGAPNLTDNIWLYGSPEETIAESIRHGRNNNMPAQLERLGPAKLHLLTAYVWGLGGGEPPIATEPAAPTVPAEAPPAAAAPATASAAPTKK
ncbi:MAG: cytochrome-c oxidase, cbb3-type subunit III [Nitrosomonadaceae bacterium]|jgi:cytochrome c oxidase cbb3-type subunit 3|nr:cytochrome-c oxidase, cbb3-type subunit III [Nitrosomonadaceae bacterium]